MPEAEEVATAIAQTTRRLRAERSWSLDQLAGRSGVSKGMLIQIEQARTNPSIGTLCRLADAFGITLAQLVELDDGSAVRTIAPDDVVRLWTGEEGSYGDLLAGTDRSEHVELWRWVLGPGEGHESPGHAAETRELLAVLGGTITLTVGEEVVAIPTGGAVIFEADRPHRYENAHRRAAEFVLVVVQPPNLDGPTASHPS